jgi:DNA-binding XRE family transcriptional regulator
MTTLFLLLLNSCGLSQKEAADTLDARLDTIKSWSSGRRTPPPNVLALLRHLASYIDRRADDYIVFTIDKNPQSVEIGYCADDAEAKSLGFPCVGAHNALIARLIAGLPDSIEIKIVPRGSTPTTAAAADAHQK